MTWRTSTTFRVIGLGFLVLFAVVPQRPYLYVGAGFLIVGWLLLLRERRRYRP